LYRRMLVPLDGSELAEAVLPYAKELAGRLDLELILLHVCEQHRIESQFMCQSYIDHAAEIVKVQSREVQASTGVQKGRKAVEARAEVITGNPAEGIIDYAGKHHIDLILLATHGRSGIRRWVMGSVADKVLRASQVPIWLVRAAIPEKVIHDEWPRRTFLVPLDGSKLAESVLPHVEALAKQRGAELVNIVLLRVFEEPYVNADYPQATLNLTWKEHVKRVRGHFKKEAETYLAEVQTRLADSGLKVRSEVLMGNPADEIIKYADKNHPNLVIMASHSHPEIRRWEFGSVAYQILHGVPSPVFIVRPH
jgi:nucleotide-binding universal stress UspA family protein